MKPIVSVVIPTYNRARDLTRALRSVLGQTYPHWEVLVVDNHSSDDTDDMVREFADSRIALHKVHNEGIIARSRNLGIAAAAGRFIAFLDSDDWWSPPKLEESVRALEQGSGADVVYHDLFTARTQRQRVFLRKTRARAVTSPVYDDLIVGGNALVTSSVVARTALLQRIGGFSEDPALVAAEDYDCWLRLARVTERFTLIPKTLGFYWLGGGNSSSPERSLRFLERLNELHFQRFRPSGGARLPLWASYQTARCSYLARPASCAMERLDAVPMRSAPWLVKLKVQWMRLRLRFG